MPLATVSLTAWTVERPVFVELLRRLFLQIDGHRCYYSNFRNNLPTADVTVPRGTRLFYGNSFSSWQHFTVMGGGSF